jgi:hypothetical protein
MGDHRVSFKIEMDFHGVKDTYEAYLNWTSTEVDGVDDRIIHFVRDIYERGMEVYHAEMYESRREQERIETEAREKRELARLKAKYEGETAQEESE